MHMMRLLHVVWLAALGPLACAQDGAVGGGHLPTSEHLVDESIAPATALTCPPATDLDLGAILQAVVDVRGMSLLDEQPPPAGPLVVLAEQFPAQNISVWRAGRSITVVHEPERVSGRPHILLYNLQVWRERAQVRVFYRPADYHGLVELSRTGAGTWIVTRERFFAQHINPAATQPPRRRP